MTNTRMDLIYGIGTEQIDLMVSIIDCGIIVKYEDASFDGENRVAVYYDATKEGKYFDALGIFALKPLSLSYMATCMPCSSNG